VSRALAPSVEGLWMDPGQGKSKTKTFAPVASLISIHHLRPKVEWVGPVTGWGIKFICSMVLRCAGNLKPGLSLDQLQRI